MVDDSEDGQLLTLRPRRVAAAPRAPVAWSTVAAAALVGTIAAGRVSEHGTRLTAALAVGLPVVLGCLIGLAYGLLKVRYLGRVRLVLTPDSLTKVPLFGKPISCRRDELSAIVARSLTFPSGGAVPYTVVVDHAGRPRFAFGTWWWSFDALHQFSVESGLRLEGSWSTDERISDFADRYPAAVPWAMRHAPAVGYALALVAIAVIVPIVILVGQ